MSRPVRLHVYYVDNAVALAHAQQVVYAVFFVEFHAAERCVTSENFVLLLQVQDLLHRFRLRVVEYQGVVQYYRDYPVRRPVNVVQIEVVQDSSCVQNLEWVRWEILDSFRKIIFVQKLLIFVNCCNYRRVGTIAVVEQNVAFSRPFHLFIGVFTEKSVEI